MSEQPTHAGSPPLLDHLILRVADTQVSLHFYREVFGFERDRSAPCAIRINDDCVIDLLQQAPADRQHLAFAFDRRGFDTAFAHVQALGLDYGSAPFARDGDAQGLAHGARGWTRSLYFYDPDGHNLELRLRADDAPMPGAHA